MIVSRINCCLLVVAFIMLVHAYKKDSDFLKAERYDGMTKIILRVHDESDVPVACTDVKVLMGMTLRKNAYYITGQTDTNGLFIIEGITTGNEIVITLNKSGYYSSSRKLCYIEMGSEHEVCDGKWQPWGMVENIELRSIVNPLKNYVHANLFIDIPRTNVWIGFDFERQGLLKPYGKGQIADVEVKVDWDMLPPWKSTFCQVSMRFPHGHSGGIWSDSVLESVFPFAYRAVENGLYEIKTLLVVDRTGPSLSTRVPFPENRSMTARVRCCEDEKGRIIQQNFVSIRNIDICPSKYGTSLLSIMYVFNSTPNDTNLEATCR